MEHFGDVISAAAQSPLGILALGMLVVGGASRAFIDTQNHPGYGLAALAMMIAAFLVAGWAIISQSNRPEPEPRQVVVGFVYYEIGDNGDVTEDGRLRLLRDGPAEYSDLRVTDVLQAAGNDGIVDGTNIREDAKATSRIKRTMAAGECVVVIAPPQVEIVTQDEGVSSGGWLNVQTTTC